MEAGASARPGGEAAVHKEARCARRAAETPASTRGLNHRAVVRILLLLLRVCPWYARINQNVRSERLNLVGGSYAQGESAAEG